MPEWLAPIIAFLKSGWTVALTVFFTLTLALIGPPWLLVNLGVANLIAAYREWIGAGWLISACLVAAKVLIAVWPKLAKLFGDYQEIARTRKDFKKLVDSLTDDECAFLRKFDSEKRSAVDLPCDDVSVRLLLQKKILVVVPQRRTLDEMRSGIREITYRVSDDIWDYLQKEIRANPDLLSRKSKT